MSIDWGRVATSWQTDRVALAGLALEITTAVLYSYGVWRLRRHGKRWPIARTASFLLGLCALAAVLQSGLAGYDDELLWVHMVQHLVIMMLSAPLLALGAPVRLSLAAGPPGLRRFIAGLLHDPSLQMVQGRWAVVLLPLDYFGSMALFLLTPLYRLTEVNNGFHEFVHVYFLACGLLFWVSLLGADPSPWRPHYRVKLTIVSIGIPVFSAIAAAMVAEGRWLSPEHSATDLHRGAFAMCVGGILLTLGATLLLWQREQGRREQVSRPSESAIFVSPRETGASSSAASPRGLARTRSG
jgi:cytochrome c oxidase assembly factor CtaG